MRKLIEGGKKIGNWIVVSEDSEIQSSFLETPNTLAQDHEGSHQKKLVEVRGGFRSPNFFAFFGNHFFCIKNIQNSCDIII